jgi:hypothetical protein
VPRLKNAWSYTSTPQYAFIEWCSVKKETLANDDTIIIIIIPTPVMTIAIMMIKIH